MILLFFCTSANLCPAERRGAFAYSDRAEPSILKSNPFICLSSNVFLGENYQTKQKVMQKCSHILFEVFVSMNASSTFRIF